MTPPGFIRSELAVWVGAATTVLFLLFGKSWTSDLGHGTSYAFLFLWLFVAILWMAFGVVRHADCLAALLGEPYGTLILTLSVIGIEAVMIAAVMLTGPDNPGLARDTMFAVLMIVLNGMVGITMLLSAWRHHAPAFNLQGASAYLGVIVPLAALTLVLPRFTPSAPGGQPSPIFAAFLILASSVLYGVFLGIQTMRHRAYFVQPGVEEESSHDDHGDLPVRSVTYHAVFLILSMLPIILLAKSMATLVEHGISVIGAPQALGGFLIAILILSPEALAGFRAALRNRLQRSMNICLGSAVSTIGLTVPVVLAISFATGKPIELGLEPVELVLLGVTLVTIIVNTSSGRTNVLQGAVHVLLFLTYVVLVFD